MNEHYMMDVRDADMRKRKALMLSQLAFCLKEAGGSNGSLTLGVVNFIETCARNGIMIRANVIKGPYAVKRRDDGTMDYS